MKSLQYDGSGHARNDDPLAFEHEFVCFNKIVGERGKFPKVGRYIGRPIDICCRRSWYWSSTTVAFFISSIVACDPTNALRLLLIVVGEN